jgi:hypothetical protein
LQNALPLGPQNTSPKTKKSKAADKSVRSTQNPAQAETEDNSKIKDRFEALLFAETLQETLFPNANPGKGSVGGCSEFDAKSRCEDSTSSPDTSSLVLGRFVIPK